MPQHKMTTEDYKDKVYDKYGNNVEILSEYKGGTEPINILYHCEKHGDIYKTLNAKNVLAKSFQPCDECRFLIRSYKRKTNTHKDKKYFYNKLKKHVENMGGELLSDKWIKAKSLYTFRCENNHIFENNADKILNSCQWCPYCCGRKGDFEEEIGKIVKSKNGELLSKYINANTHVKVRCNVHNYEWYIMPLNIKKGRWCPICNMIYSEKVVYDYLINNGYNIKPQFTFKDLKSKITGEYYRFDFAILDNNNNVLTIIEVDGDSHEKELVTIENDDIKNKYCSKHNIKIKRLTYRNKDENFLDYNWYYNYIDKKLSNYLITINKKVV